MHSALQVYREHVGSQIRKARKSANLSHDKLATAVGTSRQHLIKLEKGKHLAGPEMMARIAEATGRPLEFFESDDDEEEDPSVVLLRAIRRIVREEVGA